MNIIFIFSCQLHGTFDNPNAAIFKRAIQVKTHNIDSELAEVPRQIRLLLKSLLLYL